MDEVLTPVREMWPLDDQDSIGLEGFYATILALCAEARELGQYSSLANPVVTGVMTDKLSMSELRDYDNYRVEGASSQFTSELRVLEEFVKTRLSGVRRLADRQRCRVSGQGEKLKPQKKARGARKGGHRSNEPDKDGKGRESYRAKSGAVHVKQPVSQPKFSPKGRSLRPSAASGDAGSPARGSLRLPLFVTIRPLQLSALIRIARKRALIFSLAALPSRRGQFLSAASGWRRPSCVQFA